MLHLAIFELAGNSPYGKATPKRQTRQEDEIAQLTIDIIDLLNSRKGISVLEDSFGTSQLVGATEQKIRSSDEAQQLVDDAMSFRRTASTEKNDASSRSHAVCRFRLENPADPEAEDGILYLIDLAGSEAARDVSQHGAERMKETREINVSLSVLKDCIRGKAEADALVAAGSRKKSHIPFRQSTLTKVLKHLFDPAGTRECKTVVIACVNPSFLDTGPSKNTLRYVEMLRVPAPKKKAIKFDATTPMTWSNIQLRQWVKENVFCHYANLWIAFANLM